MYGKKLLIVVDRYSGWLLVFDTGKGEGAKGLIDTIKIHLNTFGISTKVAPDGGLDYTASNTQRFMKDWGEHRMQSFSYFLHSNQRPQLGV